MDSDFGASAKEEAGSANPTEVRTLTIIREPRETDRRVLGDFWNGRQPQHTGVSGNLRPDAERAGLRQADEGRNLPNGWRAEEGAIPNGLLLLHGSRSREHSQASLPSSLVRWNRLSSPCHNRTEDQPASTQEGAASRPRDFWLAKQCMYITSFFYAHTTPYAYTQLGYAYTQFIYLCIHPTTIAHTHPMHTHPYAYTPICTHTHMHTHLHAYTSLYMHTHPMTLS